MPRKRISLEEELSPLYTEHIRAEQEIKPWDVFQNPPVKIETGSMQQSKWIDFSVKIFKLLAYLVTFIVVLGSAVISKGTLLFMTSQITLNQAKPYCNRDLGINQQFVVQLPEVERVAWVWMLVFSFFVPELGTFIRSLRICLFKTWKMPTTIEWISLFVTESLPTIGTALLVFCILPDLDVVKGAMLTNAICFVPAVVGFFSRNPADSANVVKMVLDITSIVAQATAFVVWPMIEDTSATWLIPVSIVLISCGWWENYVSEDSPITIIRTLGKAKKNSENGRYFIYMFLSLWKCLLFFISLLIIVWVKEGSVDFLFEQFSEAFEEHYIHVTEIQPIIGGQSTFDIREVIQTGQSTKVLSENLAPVWVFLINIITTYLCYVFGKFACKILIQGFSYAFPINLTVPVTISFLIAACGVYNGNECAFYGHIPPYLFFNSPPVYFLHDFIASEHSWIWLLWLLSQTWITIHIWTPHCERLARTEKLYVRPMYDAFLIDQSIAMNRRRDDKPENVDDDEDDSDDEGEEQNRSPIIINNNRDEITRIYACGTMWHETKEEMMEFLKSVMRLDEDQCARRLVREELGFNMSDYYEIETHVFFDDAYIRISENDNDPRVNEYVKDLVMAMDEAASNVHQTRIRVRPPKKYITPYGGRLVWTLPGKTKLFAHLKDKKKIRPKKRWSQVMYMYYLLGHRLMEREDLSPKRKEVVADNTYLLALDGDIDFQPEAVHLLVDLMKKNKTVGAACGRIHPLGSGPMVWYQMFEYAVGHWLQKATEHMIGCVLCSPGCFSLFRAKALMDHSVMGKYTTRSVEARDFVQFDQGEDRWLCTLLLQRGYRVEYSAASDAFTHCPEGFNEFYNQRRRWIPSTTANILDLLMNYKRTIKINDNISRLYIMYQIVLMVGTILGPGTIFLMLVGAFVAAFQMDQWSSFLWNAVPILLFMGICFLFKSDIQLLFAGIISAVYGLVMMAVLVGVMLQISNDGLLAPSSLFFFCVAGEMIFAALLHPKEFGCLPYGIVYYVTVPSMYMLLIIYCIFNLNNISWGTREVTVAPKQPDEIKEASPKQTNETKPTQSQNKILAFFGNSKNEDNAGTFEFSIAGLLKCMWCTHRKNGDENIHLLRIANDLKMLSEKLDAVERVVRNQPDIQEERPLQQQHKTTHLEGSKGTEVGQFVDTEHDSSVSDRKSQISDVLEPNNWLDEEDLGRGEYDCISTNERVFWEGLLDKYLHPIEDNKEKVARDLKDLRDKAVMAFFMLNALFVLVVFLLTLKKDLLHINWPFGVKVNFTYLDDVGEIEIYKEYLELEPIGFVFLFFFASLLVVQFIAMLFHRFGTFSQILATTYVNWGFCTTLDKKNLTEEQILENDPVKVVKQLIKIRGVEDEDEGDVEEPAVGRRKTVKHLAESGHKKQSVNDLFEAFERRTTKFVKNGMNVTGRKSMAVIINQRRNTVHNLKRASHVQFTLPNNNLDRGYTNNAFEETESPL